MKKGTLAFAVTSVVLPLFCSCASAPAAPRIVGSATVEGHGYPSGSSDSADFAAPVGPASAADYGYSPKVPVLVGGESMFDGPRNSRLYLNSLRGPRGQVLHYERRGSCCAFKTEHSELGTGLLDVYEVTYEGLDQPLLLYLDMYDPGETYIPKGLTARR